MGLQETLIFYGYLALEIGLGIPLIAILLLVVINILKRKDKD